MRVQVANVVEIIVILCRAILALAPFRSVSHDECACQGICMTRVMSNSLPCFVKPTDTCMAAEAVHRKRLFV